MRPTFECDLGDTVRIEGVFRNVDKTKVDPTTVTFKVRNPAGEVTTKIFGTDVEIVKDSLGTFHQDIDANLEGWWYYRIFSTGSGKAATEGSFRVNRSNFS